MKQSLLQYLECPFCAGEFLLNSEQETNGEIMSGGLSCAQCRRIYPIHNGVPRFAEPATDDYQRETAKNFGAQWLVFDHVDEHHTQQFLDWIAPVTPAFVAGKVVLEGGCGKGRHTRLIGEWGARAVVGVDLSDAVEAAYRNTKDLPNVHIIQADIYRLPLKQSFDYAFSVGVLHHLPDPRGGFASLIKRVKPGGAISAWVYGRENNDWIVNYINPLRKKFTSQLSMKVLYYLSSFPSAILYLILKLVYAPLSKTKFSGSLFYAEYLNYIARFPFREIHNIVHDHLTAPVAFYLTQAEFREWFTGAGAERVEIHWHNRNSWRGFARTSSSAQAGEQRDRPDRAEASHANQS